MTYRNETKTVREARAKARRLARTTSHLTYQQALDQVARDEGAEHWSAFVSSRKAEMDDAPAPKPSPIARASGVGDYVRSLATGERAAQQERLRAAVIIQEEPTSKGHGLWLSVAGRIIGTPLAILMIGAIMRIAVSSGSIALSWGDLAKVSACALGLHLATFLTCLAIGDQPGMERRRATVWSLLCWMQALGFVIFILSGMTSFDQALQRLTGITPVMAIFIGIGCFVFGSHVRNSLHALMVLGAVLGPKSSSGGSIADLAAIARSRASQPRPPRRPPLTREEARELGRPKPWWRKIGIFEIVVGSILFAAILSFVALGLKLAFGIDARPVAWVAVAIFSPFFVGAALLCAMEFIGEVMHMPRLNGMDARLRAAERDALRRK